MLLADLAILFAFINCTPRHIVIVYLRMLSSPPNLCLYIRDERRRKTNNYIREEFCKERKNVTKKCIEYNVINTRIREQTG